MNSAGMRFVSVIAMGFVLFVSGGATCSRRPAPSAFPPPPVVFSETPSLDEVLQVVNRTANVTQLSTNSASVEVTSMQGLPRLGATMNLQRDRNFRLRASVPFLLGSGLDMGSNNETFWFEVPNTAISKTLYFANHDQYQQTLDRAILPVDPTWVMDSLGLVQIDPATVVAGPNLRQDGKLEIQSAMAMPAGTFQRVVFIQKDAGYVTDQFLYNPSGDLVAQSQATNHQYYSAQQVSLPHRVDISLAPAVGPPLSMRIDIGDYTVNQLLSGDPSLFVMPTTATQTVDLASPQAAVPMLGGTTGPTEYTADASIAYPLRGTTR
jgi:hypothetical protein